MMWQPIETAPKDGTRITLGTTEYGGVVWNDCRWEKMTRKPDRWASFIGPVPWTPTHWMPLPPPPAMAPTGEPTNG
jgi:hypothetical protein